MFLIPPCNPSYIENIKKSKLKAVKLKRSKYYKLHLNKNLLNDWPAFFRKHDTFKVNK